MLYYEPRKDAAICQFRSIRNHGLGDNKVMKRSILNIILYFAAILACIIRLEDYQNDLRHLSYYQNREHYVTSEAVIAEYDYTMDSKTNQPISLRFYCSAIPNGFYEKAFVLEGENLEIALQNGLQDMLTAGTTIVFSAAPAIMWNGYRVPVVAISVERQTVLSFDTGFSKLNQSIKTQVIKAIIRDCVLGAALVVSCIVLISLRKRKYGFSHTTHTVYHKIVIIGLIVDIFASITLCLSPMFNQPSTFVLARGVVILLNTLLYIFVRKDYAGTIHWGNDFVELYDPRYRKKTVFMWKSIRFVSVKPGPGNRLLVEFLSDSFELTGIVDPKKIVSAFQKMKEDE